jgi:hypothetical protein
VFPKRYVKKTRELKSHDISASWLSHGDPVGFPPHPRGWFSFVLYQPHSYRISARKLIGINVRLRRRYLWVVMQHLLFLFDISVSQMVRTGRNAIPGFSPQVRPEFKFLWVCSVQVTRQKRNMEKDGCKALFLKKKSKESPGECSE